MVGSCDFAAGRINLEHNGFDPVVVAGLLQRQPHIFHHRFANAAGNRAADQTAQADQGDAIGNKAGPPLDDDLAEPRDRFFHPHAGGKSAESGNRQHEIDENAGTKRDEQKDTETTEFAISHCVGSNWRRTGAGTSGFRRQSNVTYARWPGRLRSSVAGLEAAWDIRDFMSSSEHASVSESASRRVKKPRTKARSRNRGRNGKGGQNAETKTDPATTMAAAGTLTRTKALLLAALRVWELKHRIHDRD